MDLDHANAVLIEMGYWLCQNIYPRIIPSKKLLLGGNQIEDVEVASALSFAVKTHLANEDLCISHCGLCKNSDILPEILSSVN